MITIPDDILERIVAHCLEHSIAMAQIGTKSGDVTMLLFARRDMTPTEASIIAAHMLLTGIVSGEIVESNIKHIENETKIPKVNLN